MLIAASPAASFSERQPALSRRCVAAASMAASAITAIAAPLRLPLRYSMNHPSTGLHFLALIVQLDTLRRGPTGYTCSSVTCERQAGPRCLLSRSHVRMLPLRRKQPSVPEEEDALGNQARLYNTKAVKHTPLLRLHPLTTKAHTSSYFVQY